MRSYDLATELVLDAADGPNVLRDAHVPSIRTSSISGYAQPQPSGEIDFVAQWQTRRSTHPDYDSVTFRPKSVQGGVPPHCALYPETTLNRNSPGVEYSYQTLPDGDVLHVMRWIGLSCQAPCTFQFKVQSQVGSAVETSAWYQFTVPVCAQ